MALTRRQIATIASIFYLGALTVLAGYASYSSNHYSLPIPNSLNALTVALPPIAGLCLEFSNALTSSLATSPKHHLSSRKSTIPPVLLPSTLTIVLLLVYETVVATLAGTRITPIDGLNCSLQTRWTDIFRAKDGETIRNIQREFQCCGFRSVKDMSYPFPSGNQGAQCVERYGYTRPCLEPWRAEEQLVSGLVLAVAVGVFVWMVIIVITPAVHPFAGQRQSAEEDDDEQRVIEYAPYSDNAEDANGGGDDTSVRREIAGLNNQSQLASLVEGGRVHPSVLSDDANRWREPPSAT